MLKNYFKCVKNISANNLRVLIVFQQLKQDVSNSLLLETRLLNQTSIKPYNIHKLKKMCVKQPTQLVDTKNMWNSIIFGKIGCLNNYQFREAAVYWTVYNNCPSLLQRLQDYNLFLINDDDYDFLVYFTQFTNNIKMYNILMDRYWLFNPRPHHIFFEL